MSETNKKEKNSNGNNPHSHDKDNLNALIDKATAGDKESLEIILLSVRDLVFNLSLRMLGTFHDAEDATQDILLKVMTHLSSFRKESSFSTWVFRIATNYLINYKKHMFAKFPLNFEFYGDDIENGKIQDVPDLTQNVEKAILAEELKNVLYQCDAAVSGHGEPVYFRFGDHVSGGQPYRRGCSWNNTGNIPAASFQNPP